jgi:dethiobiotin synthetase
MTIALTDLESLAGRLATDRTWIVEGAGGALVPLNDRELMTDWMARLGLPVLECVRWRVE